RWPPEELDRQEWRFHPGSLLSEKTPPDSEPDLFYYDPADPTPSVGGAARIYGRGRCSVDNRPLEARADVLTYTSKPLDADLEVMGTPTARLFVKPDLEHCDLFVRLCDVGASGKSLNVCDGRRRLRPGFPPAGDDGVRMVDIRLWPT